MTIDKTYKPYYPWTHYGKLTILIKASDDKPTPTPTPTPQPEPTTGTRAIVVAESGGTVNMRVGPGLKQRLICRVPLGCEVIIMSPGEEWCRVEWNNFRGYMMAKFLDIIGDGKGKY
jgi:hypothetical protein